MARSYVSAVSLAVGCCAWTTTNCFFLHLYLRVKVGTKEQNRGTKKANSMILLLVSSALLPSQV